MAHWIIESGYCMCSRCRHVWNDIIDNVSEVEECPNCGASMCLDEIIKRDHLLIAAGVKAGEMDNMGTIDIYSDDPGKWSLETFITYIVDRYCEMDEDMDFDEYVENNLILAYS